MRCRACRATVTVNEADKMPSRQNCNEVILEALSVAWHEMPSEGGGGAPTRTTRSERGRRAKCSIFQGLIEEIAHVQVSCSCDVHRRCALGFCDDVIPRARYVGGASQVTCLNPALHEEHHEVDIHPLLQQIRALGRSADRTEERVIRERATAAELRLLRRTHTSPKRVDSSRTATERGEEDLQGEWRGTNPQSQVQAPLKTARALLFPAGSFRGDARQKAQRGQPTGDTTCSRSS